MNRCALLGVDFGLPEWQDSMDELELLARSAGGDVISSWSVKRQKPDSALFVGSGKVEELRAHCEVNKVDLVIFNHALSPAQHRNLEAALPCRVLDRTGLILDIFAIRAKSFEGRLQVELAQLQYQASRLVRSRSDLLGQQGGIGMRGPGETQLETDRRLIVSRVKQLKTRLEKIHIQRQTQRRQRLRNGQFTVALVGYTNAGKSTLFNALANAKAYAADQLFATLDTTSRRVYLGDGINVVLSDTVGFVRDLSHNLIEAFKATLESAVEADVLLHVIDSTAPNRETQMQEVNKVLAEINAQYVPQVVVWNKIDAAFKAPARHNNAGGNMQSVSVSARTGSGLELLRQGLLELAFAHHSHQPPHSINQQQEWS